jgi:hypothetical protein
MSRKKTSKSKAGSVPAASALPAANGSRPARPGSAHPGSETPPNGPPQPSRRSLGGGGDFYYDVAFKVSYLPPHPQHTQASAAGGVGSEPKGRGRRGVVPGSADPSCQVVRCGTPWLARLHCASCARAHTQLSGPSWRYSTAGRV